MALPATRVMSISDPTHLGNRPTIIGQSSVMTQMLGELRRLAQIDAKVLITGESGVGKELVARFVHAHSRRAGRPFVAVNCAGLPETLLESELFGHVKGSFTGAYRDKCGKFELAHTGTLFLDEVGEMTLRMQSLLLRVLETGELQKVGSDHLTVRADVRIIAATNRSITDLIRDGSFREDLYYRLNVIHIRVPPLRERPEDIPLLADYFLKRAAAQVGVECSASPQFYDAIQRYDWPGNVRQVDNMMQRLVVNASDGTIRASDLPSEIYVHTPNAGSDAPLRPQPRPERRRAVSEVLYQRIRAGASFWDVVYRPFMEREITKADVRGVVDNGLKEAVGNYRVVTRLLNVPGDDYRRFLCFLRKHGCLLPYRDYR